MDNDEQHERDKQELRDVINLQERQLREKEDELLIERSLANNTLYHVEQKKRLGVVSKENEDLKERVRSLEQRNRQLREIEDDLLMECSNNTLFHVELQKRLEVVSNENEDLEERIRTLEQRNINVTIQKAPSNPICIRRTEASLPNVIPATKAIRTVSSSVVLVDKNRSNHIDSPGDFSFSLRVGAKTPTDTPMATAIRFFHRSNYQEEKI